MNDSFRLVPGFRNGSCPAKGGLVFLAKGPSYEGCAASLPFPGPMRTLNGRGSLSIQT